MLDDPPGLERSGDGRFAKGSAGPTGQGRGKVITVTSSAGDTSVGTIRWAYAQINSPSKVELSASLDGQFITFPPNFQLKWDKPYTTLDCSQTSARFRTANAAEFSQGIVIGGTHDVIVYSCGGVGWFNEANPQVPANNRSVISLANFVAVRYSWDDTWDATPSTKRGTPRDILIDRAGCSNAQDDCLAVYDGASDVSILRFLNRRGWHPMTCGSNGFKPVGDPKERRRVTWAYGVTYKLGARQIRSWRGCRDWSFVRNALGAWEEWVAPGGPINPNGGLWLEDDAGGENDIAYVVGNLGIPGADNPNNGCFVGSDARCDAIGTGAPGNYAVCNPKMANTRWWFDRNSWGGSKDCVTNPPGYTPKARLAGEPAAPKFDEARPWSKVFTEAGPVKRLPAEQADIDWIAARLPQ